MLIESAFCKFHAWHLCVFAEQVDFVVFFQVNRQVSQLEESKEKVLAEAERLSKNRMDLKREVDELRRGLQHMVCSMGPGKSTSFAG